LTLGKEKKPPSRLPRERKKKKNATNFPFVGSIRLRDLNIPVMHWHDKNQKTENQKRKMRETGFCSASTEKSWQPGGRNTSKEPCEKAKGNEGTKKGGRGCC